MKNRRIYWGFLGFFFLVATSVQSAGDRGQEARSLVDSLNSGGSQSQINEAKALLEALPTRTADASEKDTFEKAAALVEDLVPDPRCQAGSLESLREESEALESNAPDPLKDEASGLFKAFGRPRDLDSFYVFVTLSMGDETLRALSRDVQKIGGRLVIRGLINNEFKATQARLASLKIAVDIDPPLFQKFEVTAVPTFIHVTKGDPEAALMFDRVRGNVTVAEALSQMKERGEVPGADAHLAHLGETS